MRIVSYNILDGGARRAEQLLQVLRAQRPDVIGLVEAGDPGVLEQLANALKMDYVRVPGNESGASAILSRFAIRDSINHAPFQPALSKSLLQASIVDPTGQVWQLGVVHLHARASEDDERKREAEIDAVLKVFEPLRAQKVPHFLLGDFNANSPVQEIDLAKVKPSTREQAAANGDTIPRRVVQRILNEGYADTYYSVNPERAKSQGTFNTEFPGQRVDYIFGHSIAPGRIGSAWIEYAPPAKDASDHYPIGIEIA
jgi:endonuclease/exonuclease/phosphatase family metal-dependent hydrolase